MITQIAVDGFNELTKALEEHKEKDVFVLCTGSIDPASGGSWCPDCVKADPVIEKALEKAPDDAVFILCHVGQRDYWKDPNNEFRKHPKFLLKGIPTLMKYNTPEKLGPEECAKEDLVNMLFEG